MTSEVDTDAPLILVADDDEAVLELITRYLGNEGYRVIAAKDGEQALTMAVEQLPALVILDLVMPKLYGFAVARRLRAQEATSHIPVIIVTAHSDLESTLRGLEIGADSYLEKPFSAGDLVAQVRKSLQTG